MTRLSRLQSSAGTRDAAAGAGHPGDLLADAGHSLGTSAILIVLGLAASILIARLLGPAGKGGYDLLLGATGLVVTLGGLSLANGVAYHVARGKTRVRPLVGKLALLSLLLMATSAVLLRGIEGTPFQRFLLPETAGAFTIAGVVALVGLLSAGEHWRAMLTGMGRIRAANARDTAQSLSFVLALGVLGVLAIAGSRIGYTSVLWASVAAHAVGGALLLTAALAAGRGERTPALADVLRYSVPAHSGNVAQFLNYRLDIFLVSYFAGLQALGLYTVAVGVSQLLWLGSRAAARVVLPWVAGSAEGTGSTTALVARLSLWSALLGSGILILGGRWLIGLLFGARFSASYAPMLLLLIGATPFTLSNVLAAHLGGLGLPNLNLRAALLGLVATVVLDLLLIPPYGIAGAALATSVSYLLTTAAVVAYFQRRSPVPLRDLFLPRPGDAALVRQIAGGMLATIRRPAGRRP